MKSLLFLFVALPACFLAGCAGIGFESAWEESVAAYEAGDIDDSVAGPWEGTWRTETNGHEGDLRCIASPTDEKGIYEFWYHATWFRIFRGGYKVYFDVAPGKGGYVVSGEEDLGLFGTFAHDGVVKGRKFHATYTNERRNQEGAFRLQRP